MGHRLFAGIEAKTRVILTGNEEGASLLFLKETGRYIRIEKTADAREFLEVDVRDRTMVFVAVSLKYRAAFRVSVA